MSTPIDWSALSPDELARALATILKLVAYAWKERDDGTWVRHDVAEYGCAWAGSVERTVSGTYFKTVTSTGMTVFPDAEQAKVAADERLKQYGWVLSNVEAPPHL